MLKHDLLPSWYELYNLNKKVGHRNDIFRNVEDSFVIKFGNFLRDDTVLDIGCGDSTIPFFLSSKMGCRVHVIDIDESALSAQKEYCRSFDCSLIIEQQDATKLSYADNTFDKIIAISSIEHIPGNGDVLAMNEFLRVLKPKGKCLVTVPFGEYQENDSTWYYPGFERRYDLKNLHQRLLIPEFKIESLLFLSSPKSGFIEDVYQKMGSIFEVYYKGDYHNTDDNLSIGLTLGWIELTETPQSSFGALICLTKGS